MTTSQRVSTEVVGRFPPLRLLGIQQAFTVGVHNGLASTDAKAAVSPGG